MPKSLVSKPGIALRSGTQPAATADGRTEPAGTNGIGAPSPVRVCGVPLHALTMEQVIDCIEDRMDCGLTTSISVVNVAKLVNMRSDRPLRDSVLGGDLILADGAPLVWLSRLKRTPLPERVAGIDLMRELLRFAHRRRARVYFLGATRAVVDRVVAETRAGFPGVVIAGWRDGYFSESQEAAVVGAIRDCRPDILFVAMSSPKKETFLKRWGDAMAVPICHGVGGSFDVVAGVTRRAPLWMQRTGLEWFYRVCQEPRRMWRRYLTTNTKFLFLAVGDLLGLVKDQRLGGPA